MRVPTGVEYAEALQNPETCFIAHELRKAEVEANALGLPRAVSGNFASVFKLTMPDGSRAAIKCFTQAANSQAVRFSAISARLSKLEASWKVPFEFVEKGIFVQGAWLPILKMEWVEGTTLLAYLEAHHRNAAVVRKLLDQFLLMVAELDREGIAHGDLQHGNILVSANGIIKLIDYDGFYVPGLESLGSCEIGQPNYQSPARGAGDFGAHLDRFSTWVIFLSLTGIIRCPQLWDTTRKKGDECLLLSQVDFASPHTSPAFYKLVSCGVPEVEALAAKVAGFCTKPLIDVPRVVETSSLLSQDPNDSIAMVGRPLSIPDWLADHRPARDVEVDKALEPALDDWLSEHVPAPKAGGYLTGLEASQLTLAAGVPVAVAIFAFAVFRADVDVGFSFLAAIVTALAQLIALGIQWYTHPHTRARSDLEAAVSENRRHLERCQRFLDSGTASRAAAVTKFAERKRAIESELQSIFTKESAELTLVDSDEAQFGAACDKRIVEIYGCLQGDLAAALAREQLAHQSRYLGTTRIRGSQLNGISEELVAALAGAGISTAADFVGIELSPYSYQGKSREGARFVMPNGRRFHVPGFGPIRAQTIEKWRQTHVQKAHATQPGLVSAAQAQAIRDRVKARQDDVARDRVLKAQTFIKRRSEVRDRWFQERARLSNEREEIPKRSAQALALIDADIASARSRLAAAAWQLRSSEIALVPLAGLTFSSYLAAVLGRIKPN